MTKNRLNLVKNKDLGQYIVLNIPFITNRSAELRHSMSVGIHKRKKMHKFKAINQTARQLV